LTGDIVSNATWVCFDCRHSVRRPTFPRPEVTCPNCKQPCVCLGRKIPIPPKDKVAAWKKLWDDLQSQKLTAVLSSEKERVERRHYLEKRIVALEARVPNPGLQRQLTQLREELSSLR
jgi:hypothetical protein